MREIRGVRESVEVRKLRKVLDVREVRELLAVQEAWGRKCGRCEGCVTCMRRVRRDGFEFRKA